MTQAATMPLPLSFRVARSKALRRRGELGVAHARKSQRVCETPSAEEGEDARGP